MRCSKVSQYSIDGVFISEYESIKSAAHRNRLSEVSISRCCRGERRSCNGFIWVYTNDYESLKSRIDYYKSFSADLDGEVWRDVVGYEGLYQVSNMGRIKSLERVVDLKVGQKYKGESILTMELHKKGYYRVTLSKDGKSVHNLVHRLVCSAFIENPNNLLEVNHINGDKTDNRVDNLEWCTRSENEQHAYNTGLAKGQKGHLRPMAKPVRLIHSITDKVLDFGCIADCARFLGGKQHNVEAAIRWRATGKIKKLLNGYKVEFIA